MNLSTSKSRGQIFPFACKRKDLTPRREPPLSNARLGTMLLIGSLTILFTCFISAYIVLRKASPAWPPYGTPPLTLGLSSFNTGILVLSSVILMLSRHPGAGRGPVWIPGLHKTGDPARRKCGGPAFAGMTATTVLGTLFLGLQIWEFERLYARGLTLQTGPYGAVFYTLIGCHGLHVLGGLMGFIWSMRGPTERTDSARMYWYFVTAVWGVLFSILYIA